MGLNLLACDSEYEKIEPDENFILGFEEKVKKTIEEHKLIIPGEKVIVAVSGGKDSTVLLYVLKKLGFDVCAVTIDVHIGCYTEKNFENIKKFCSMLGVKLYSSSFRKAFGAGVCYLRDSLRSKGKNVNSCTVCGVLRRHLLNRIAKSAGASKIATGHNLDDEVQTIVMNLLRNRASLNARVGPMAYSKDERFVQRIKPLFFCREKEIENYSKMHGFPVQYKRCPCSFDGLRAMVRELFEKVEKIEPNYREKIISYFLERRKKNTNLTMPKNCAYCNEPSSTLICRACQLLAEAKSVFNEQ